MGGGGSAAPCRSLVMPTPIAATALAFVALAVAADIRSRRIPNVLSGPAIAAGLALNAVYSGGAGLGTSALGLVITVGVLLLPFALGGIGGGDVKMMGALGALLGPPVALAGLGIGMMLGGVIVAVHLARRGRLREKIRATWLMLANAFLCQSLAPLKLSAAAPDAVALPYSVPLGLGTAAAIVLAPHVGLVP